MKVTMLPLVMNILLVVVNSYTVVRVYGKTSVESPAPPLSALGGFYLK